MRRLTISNKHNIHLWGGHKIATIKTSYLKKGKWEEGQYAIYYMHTYYPAGQEEKDPLFWFQSEFLGDLFCLLLDLFSGMISLVICPVQPQLRKALRNIYFLIIISNSAVSVSVA